jgi:hypothetical protein
MSASSEAPVPPNAGASSWSASVGALSFVTLHASYSVRRKGCATPLVPDGLMVSSKSAIYSKKPKPRFSPSRGFFMVGALLYQPHPWPPAVW